MKVAAFVNAAGGAVSAIGAAAAAARIESALREQGVTPLVQVVAPADLPAALRRAAAGGQHDAIAVAGGDGTISTAAAALAGSAMPLGIVPLGTFNNFARDNGLPLDIDGAAAVIAGGVRRRVDLAEVNGRPFINNSSIGLYPYLVNERERRRRAGLRDKRLAMAAAGLRALRRLPLRRVTVVADGKARHSGRTPCVFVGNNHYDLSGVGLSNRVRLDAGELCVYVVRKGSIWGVVWLAVRTMFGFIDGAADFDQHRGLPAVTVNSRASRLPVSVDGEVVVLRPPLQYRMLPGALTILAPPP